MTKTNETLKCEQDIWLATHKQGVFCCFEVTIGWLGDERVDYLTYDTNGIWRCYEIKTSLADFNSKAKNTFIGNFNYFVMPQELFNRVGKDIPPHIGAYVNGTCVKKAKKQPLKIDKEILKDSLIRSLYREAAKVIKSDNPTIVTGLERQIARAKSNEREFRQKYLELMRIGQRKYGREWYREDSDEDFF